MNHHDLWHEIHDFLVQEARLLDDRSFFAWLDLFTDDVVYWMPDRYNPLDTTSPTDGVSKPGELALFEETKETLHTRVARLATGLAWAEVPPSRTRHLITNVQVEQSQTESEVSAHSNFLIYRTQLEHSQDLFVGTRDDVLRKVDGKWKIARRTILLDQAVLSSANLSVFF
ncbi:MAG: 3-phenylpropionate/cinnamic acid dioxygenase subunit beta [Deltaproteobacteria bacterium]|nr:3-phenylpropionate/cinnamic acid dioxygenase subunit beta [Deltaproteobacteria bacterium]MBM4299241.1 3-phenylpropionate/cinnamic acid dioxygenase subunit beta [Deltaproteobacteria bacterium]